MCQRATHGQRWCHSPHGMFAKLPSDPRCTIVLTTPRGIVPTHPVYVRPGGSSRRRTPKPAQQSLEHQRPGRRPRGRNLHLRSNASCRAVDVNAIASTKRETTWYTHTQMRHPPQRDRKTTHPRHYPLASNHHKNANNCAHDTLISPAINTWKQTQTTTTKHSATSSAVAPTIRDPWRKDFRAARQGCRA